MKIALATVDYRGQVADFRIPLGAMADESPEDIRNWVDNQIREDMDVSVEIYEIATGEGS